MGEKQPEVIVVGAGVAGLAAAAALAGDGANVTVLERRPYVGGRAYSYPHPALEEVVDSQHVLLGCCTNLLALCSAAGLDSRIRWYDEQTFLEPDGSGRPLRASAIARNGLPAPLHYTGSFLRAKMLSVPDKLAIARGLAGLRAGSTHLLDSESVAQWYRRSGQTEGAVRHFWEPIVLATLNDSAANCSMKYAGKVFYELFLKTAEGGRLGIPTVPLSEFYEAAADLARARGACVENRASVEHIEPQPGGGWLVHTGERALSAPKVVLALPFEQTRTLLQHLPISSPQQHLLTAMEHFEHAPFISILLWFDREITELDHAWLLDTTIQWFFHKSRIRGYRPERGSYVELVIAGSRRELPMGRAEILEPALAELVRFFPEAGRARLLKSGILKEARATFSVTPGLDHWRPAQQTDLPGLFLAGDWTRTGWPSTMEGAARSGHLAAGAVTGDLNKFLVPELEAAGVMALLAS